VDNHNRLSGTPYNCTIPVGDGQILAQKYFAGDWYFDNDDFSSARTQYAAIAAVPYSTRNTASTMCRHSIDVARVMTYALGTDRGQTREDNEGIDRHSKSEQLMVWPNPTSEWLQVSFGAASFDVEVLDILGRMRLSKTMHNGEVIAVADWESGIYVLTAINPIDGARKTVKFVVE
jgi:Secretion system C-terminal sorting domain